MSVHSTYWDYLIKTLGTPDGLRASGQFIRDTSIGVSLLITAFQRLSPMEVVLLIIAFGLSKPSK